MLAQSDTTMLSESLGVQVSLKELIALQADARRLLVLQTGSPTNQWVGGHVSSLRGRGMDFDEVRVYSAGDDVRTMDWRVTARSNTPHIKLYREERERPVFLVCDFSASLFFGTRVMFKSVLAARVAALIAWASALAGDRVGGVLFGEQAPVVLRPAARQHGVLPLLNALAKCTQQPKTPVVQSSDRFAEALLHCRRIAPTGSLLVILSDFESADGQVKSQLQQLAQKHQLISGLLYDPLEAMLPDIGYCVFSDGQQTLGVNSAVKSVRETYQQQFDLKTQDIQQCMTRLGQSYFQLATNQPILPIVHEVLLRCGGIRR